MHDLAEWHAALEEPVTFNYRGLDVYKCPSWTQGPVFLQQLALLEGYRPAALGHNSADYLHLVIECAKLAFADREAYYGDPLFDRRAVRRAAVEGVRRRAAWPGRRRGLARDAAG